MTREKALRNSLCRKCGVSYPRKGGVSGRFCSSLCKSSFPKKVARCEPFCKPETLFKQNVKYANGAEHTRQCCHLCKFMIYVPRDTPQIESNELGFREQAKERVKRYGDSFYSQPSWLRLRYEAFMKHGRVCMVCGLLKGEMHVDHIKPRSKYPHLELDLSNLQILCRACNLGKSNTDETDWR